MLAHLLERGLPAGVTPHPDLGEDFDLLEFADRRLGLAIRQRHLAQDARLFPEYPYQQPALPPQTHDGPLVSITMPVKNRAADIPRAIESVQRQTYHRWELLVVDDASTDDLAAALEAFADDSRIRLLPCEGSGVCDARNTALRHAEGTYVAYLDSDDTWRPEHLGLHVSFLSSSGRRASHSDMALHAPGRPVTYRAYEGGREELAYGNYIGLPSLVHERSLIEEVGLFNRELRRCVDYDLILRIADATEISHIRACTCDVNNDPSGRRISTNVVSGDCHRLRAAAMHRWFEPLRPTRTHADLGMVLVVDAVRPDATSRLLEQARAHETAICLVKHGFSTIGDALDLDSQAMLAGSEAVHLAHPGFYGLAVSAGAQTFESAVVAVIPSGLEDLDPFLACLADAFSDPDVGAVQPVVLGTDGTVVSAGHLAPPCDALSVPFLFGQPGDDAPAEVTSLDAVSSHCWAFRRGSASTGHDVDAGFRTGIASIGHSLSQRERGHTIRLLGDVRVRLLATPAQERADSPNRATDLAELAEISTPALGGGPSAEAAWSRIGIDVAGWRDARPSSRHAAGHIRLIEPVLGRTRLRGEPLRWAIKCAAPAGPRRLSWGDWHFAQALAAALRRLGQHVVVDSSQSSGRQSGYLDDVVLVLRGLQPQTLHPLHINLLWVISHPDGITDSEVGGYDAAFVASHKFARQANERGLAVEPLLQCTDPDRFSPHVPPVAGQHELLFVGNSRHRLRPMVQWAIEAGRQPHVFGRDWGGLIDSAMVQAEYIPNEDLASYYRHAGVVLNDHWPDMARDGFVSNRLFDLAASAATVVTDPVEGLEEVFGSTPRVVEGPAQLAKLLDQPHGQAFPDLHERLALADLVRADHSFDARARTLLETAQRLSAARTPDPDLASAD